MSLQPAVIGGASVPSFQQTPQVVIHKHGGRENAIRITVVMRHRISHTHADAMHGAATERTTLPR